MAISQWVLGIRPTLTGLQIAPVIPQGWPGFQARRVYRGVTYHVVVERKGEGNAVTLTVDGRPVEGNVLPLPPPDGTEVAVTATLSERYERIAALV